MTKVINTVETTQIITGQGGPQGTPGPQGDPGDSTPATATTLGSIKLAGDLGGTAPSPTVPGLATKANTADLSTEIARAEAAESTNATAITSEATTRATADTTNANAIATEITRAEAAEALLAPLDSPTFTGDVTADGNMSGANLSGTNTGDQDLSPYALTASLATVASTGSYNDLANKPTIPAAQVNSDWNASSGIAQILNKPSLATVATTGAYADLTGKPTLGTASAQNVAFFLQSANNLSDVASASTARTNLGLGSLSTLNSIDLTANVGSTVLPVANGGTDSNIKNFTAGISIIVAASNASAEVKAGADYVCDGTADDVQIQAAMDAVTTAGQGSVLLSVGTFYISAGMTFPTVPFTLYGAGMGATYIRLINSVNVNMFSYTSATDVTFALIGGFTMYGNAANQTGVAAKGTNTGIYINSTGDFWDIRFQDLFILDFRSQGFYTNYAHDYVFDHVIVEFCGLAAQDYIPAVQFDGGDEAYMTNCLVKLNNGRGASIGTYGTTINNNHIVQNGGVGLLVYAQNCSIVNNVFDDNGEIATNTYPDIWLLNPHTVVSANTFLGSTSRAEYNLQIDSGSTANVVTGNNFQNFATSAVLDAGSGTIYKGNTNWADSTVSNNLTVASNAVTVPVTSNLTSITNNAAGSVTITVATANATDGQLLMVRFYDFSAVAQTLAWSGTENSSVSAPTTSNGSTTAPLTIGFQFNSATSKWRCIASA